MPALPWQGRPRPLSISSATCSQFSGSTASAATVRRSSSAVSGSIGAPTPCAEARRPTSDPGNADGSRLYHRLIGTAFGQQMPPPGPLTREQTEIIKQWIDEGAIWPDAASGETPPPPVDAEAVRLMHAIRNGDRAGIDAQLRGQPRRGDVTRCGRSDAADGGGLDRRRRAREAAARRRGPIPTPPTAPARPR